MAMWHRMQEEYKLLGKSIIEGYSQDVGRWRDDAVNTLCPTERFMLPVICHSPLCIALQPYICTITRCSRKCASALPRSRPHVIYLSAVLGEWTPLHGHCHPFIICDLSTAILVYRLDNLRVIGLAPLKFFVWSSITLAYSQETWQTVVYENLKLSSDSLGYFPCAIPI